MAVLPLLVSLDFQNTSVSTDKLLAHDWVRVVLSRLVHIVLSKSQTARLIDENSLYRINYG